jgi:hypothetical protein
MGRALEYRCYAQKCMELVRTIRVPQARAALHHMAHALGARRGKGKRAFSDR